jgi:nucleotide-binding universal stress UspA family protein
MPTSKRLRSPSADEKLPAVHVLVGTDGSRLAVHAAQLGISLLGRPDHVTVLSVLTDVPLPVDEDWETYPLPDEDGRLWQDHLAEIDAALERTAAVVGGVQVDQRVEGGDVARKICDVARELDVDAIIVGSHMRSGVGRFVRGSVSEHVVRYAPCPVLVVP